LNKSIHIVIATYMYQYVQVGIFSHIVNMLQYKAAECF